MSFQGRDANEEQQAKQQTANTQDLRDIWGWNATVPEAAKRCVHDLIAETVRQQPGAQAVCAWDGELTYSELDERSTQLAHHLVGLGVGPGTIVPLCFEKSMWMPVAMLGVMKAGGASVALEVTQPFRRLKTIAEQTSRSVVLSSKENGTLASRLGCATILKVNEDLDLSNKVAPASELPRVSPSHTAFVTFTSGSTGTPKGACISHANISTSVRYQGSKLGFQSNSRVLDFAPYSFDVAWSNVLHTLCAGGCLCISHADDVLNDIGSCIAQMDANLVNITPTVLRTMRPGPSPLKLILLSGERPDSNVLSKWFGKVDLKNTYGPAECTFKSAFAEITAGNIRNPDIGKTIGGRGWIVNTEKDNVLVPIGQVGELLLEGPLVGQGYLNDAAKTAAAFVEDPEWLLRGGPGVPGRRGRLYKTGDLVRYKADGTLQFVGRKDSQVKIRGQRVELGEVEHHLRKELATVAVAVVAEVITPQGSDSPTLVAFVAIGESLEEKAKEILKQSTTGLDDKLAEVLPRYMIPSAYIHVQQMPTTATGKTDRRRLREIGGTWTLKELATLHSPSGERRAPETAIERQLQKLWARVLNLDAKSIALDDSFVQFGGDSIGAMRLVAVAREQGLSLTVADVFRSPRLCEMANAISVGRSVMNGTDRTPFTFLQTDDVQAYLRAFIYPLLQTKEGTILDVLPTTDFQTSCVQQAFYDPPGRWMQLIVDLPTSVDFQQLKTACSQTVGKLDILRMIFVSFRERFWQVLLDKVHTGFEIFENLQNHSNFVDAICEDDLRTKRQLGQSFVRFLAVKDSLSGNKLIFRCSHAHYDGFSLSLILETLHSFYNCRDEVNRRASFADFIVFTQEKKLESIAYWRSKMRKSRVLGWKESSAAGQSSSLREPLIMKVYVKIPRMIEGITVATQFHAACALALARYYKTSDIVFGRLVTGRAMLPVDLQMTVGPCITEVPIMVNVQEDDTLQDISIRLHHEFVRDSQFESMGMTEIIQDCTDWPEGTEDFGWGTAFQPEFRSTDSGSDGEYTVSTFGRMLSPHQRPKLYASIKGDELEIRYGSAKGVIPHTAVETVLTAIQRILSG